MAYSDYDQNQIVAQIQAYFHLNRAVDGNFLAGRTLSPIDGQLNEATTTAIQAWIRQTNPEGLTDTLDPSNPQDLSRLYAAVQAGMFDNPTLQARLQTMAQATTQTSRALEEQALRLMEEKQLLEMRRATPLLGVGEDIVRQLHGDIDARLAVLPAEFAAARDTFRLSREMGADPELREMLRAGAALLHYDAGRVPVLAADADDQEATRTAGNKLLTRPLPQRPAPLAQTQPEQVQPEPEPEPEADPEPEARPTPVATRTATPVPRPQSVDDFTIWYMSNIALNNGDYSIHTQRVWQNIRQSSEPSGQVIENYLTELARQFAEANNGNAMPANQIGQMREQLVTQIAGLQTIQRDLNGIRPTPEQIADQFIQARVATQLPADSPEIARVRNAVIAYESIQPTPEDAVRVMRESWEAIPNLPNTPDHYAQLLEQKIAHYQTAEGGNLDPMTAASRAMVDIRAQVDRDNGAVSHAIVDDRHPYYQSEIMSMGTWLRGRLYAEQQVASGAAETRLDAMETIDAFAYGVHRRATIEHATLAAAQAQPQPTPVTADPSPLITPGAPVPQTALDNAAAFVTRYASGLPEIEQNNIRDMIIRLESFGAGIAADDPALAENRTYAEANPLTGRDALQAAETVGLIDLSTELAAKQQGLTPGNIGMEITHNDDGTLRSVTYYNGMEDAATRQTYQMTGEELAAVNQRIQWVQQNYPRLAETLRAAGLPAYSHYALTAPESAPLPDPGPATQTFGEEFHANNPFRTTVALTALENPGLVDEQANNLARAIALSSENGQVTLDQAVLTHLALHTEGATGALSDDQKASLAVIAAELGVEPGHSFAANDPRLLEAVAAYANGMPVADLPAQWKQSFAQAAAGVSLTEARPADPVVDQRPGRLSDEFASEAATPAPQLAPLNADEVSTRLDQLSGLTEAHMNNLMTRGVTEKVQALYEARSGGDPARMLQAGHQLATTIAGSAATQQMDLLRQNWDNLHPYFARIGETVGPTDYEKGLQILRTRSQDILGANQWDSEFSYDLPDRIDSFRRLEGIRTPFAGEAAAIETMAARSGVDLTAPAPATEQTPEAATQQPQADRAWYDPRGWF